MIYRYLIGLGSNERAEERFSEMVDALLQEFGSLCLSPVCRTEAVNGDGPEYLNAVASLESSLLPPEFRAACKVIENRLGRVRPSNICAADIDILACWEQPPQTRARDFISETYFQPQADCVLDCLGLNKDSGPFSYSDAVSLALKDGRIFGQDTVLLKVA